MKFVAKEDIEAPIDQVFGEVADFEGFQRSAIRRGIKVVRLDSLTEPGPGMKWDSEFELRGRKREMTVTLADFDSPNGMKFEAASPGMNAFCNIELMPLSRNRTRMRFEIELKPQNLAARLMVQSLKLAKASLTKRLNLRLADFASYIEGRTKRRA